MVIGDTAEFWLRLEPDELTATETILEGSSATSSFAISRTTDAFISTGFTSVIKDTDGNVLTLPSEMIGKPCLVKLTATADTTINYIGNDTANSTVLRGLLYDFKLRTIHFSIEEGEDIYLCSDKNS